jgi:hypothetical protein
MYEIRNLKRTPTPVVLIGQSLLLPKDGTANIRDRQAEEDTVKALAKLRFVKLTELDEEDPPEDVDSAAYKELLRVRGVHQSLENAARRARGELV